MEPLRELGLSALGTVSARHLEAAEGRGESLSPAETTLLQHALEAGVSDMDFFVVRKLCAFAKKPGANLEALLLCERLATSEGGTYLDLDKKRLAALLAVLGREPKQIGAILRMLPKLPEREPGLFAGIKDTDKVVPFLIDLKSQKLYRHAFLTAEQRIAAALRQKMQRPWRDPSQTTQVFETVTRKHPLGLGPWPKNDEKPPERLTLAAEQQLAALAAVCSPLTIISGGPGTGKTSIVTTILRMLTHLDTAPETIAMTAPTGRAANRMAESIRAGLETINPVGRHPILTNARFEPQTLHRLLGWTPRGYRYHADNPLEADWVIVDEVSMVDLLLMERLLDALKPETNLILLGDADQLPSVAAGAVFRDLLGLAAPPNQSDPQTEVQSRAAMAPGTPARHIIQLTQSFRQKGDWGGRHILAVAKKTNQMAASDLFGLFPDEHIQILPANAPAPFDGVTLIESNRTPFPTLTNQLYKRFYQNYQRLAQIALTDLEHDRATLTELFSALDRLKILCLTRKSRFGVDSINRLFRSWFHRGDRPFYPGLPWMVTRNDHRMGLYNGDIGIGLLFKADHGPMRRMLVFHQDQQFKRIPFESLSGLEPAFAMTVHKSQGSEADHVVLVLPEEKNALCKKEVIYTALTRAKKSVTIYGTPAVLEAAVSDHMHRLSGLGSLLNIEVLEM